MRLDHQRVRAPEPPRPLLDLRRVQCLGQALREAMLPRQSQRALVEYDRERTVRQLTYREVRAEAAALGARLQAQGIGPGDRVAIVMSNQSRWLTSALGVLWTGATLVPLDLKLEADALGRLLEHAQARALIIEHPQWRRLTAAGVTLPASWVSEVPDGAALPADAHLWHEPTEHDLRMVDPARDSVACVVYSSGTGGEIKGCELTHHAYLSQAEVLGNLFPMEESDCFFSILPTNHAIDFMCGFVVPFLFGASVVHQRTLRPQYLSSTLKLASPTHMALVPMVLTALRQKVETAFDDLPPWQRSMLDGLLAANRRLTEDRPRPQLSRLLLGRVHQGLGGRMRVMVCGGAKVPAQDAQFFTDLGIPVAVGYGLTEACTVVTVTARHPFRADSVGPAVPGTEIQVRERDAQGVGEVWVRGPTLMRGYLHDPELTASTLQHGWLRTGDLGRIDAAGHLVLVGRRRNMIVTAGGKNIYPEDVEEALGGVPGIEELCVFAADYLWPRGELTGETLIAVARAQSDADADAVQAELAARNRTLAVHRRVHRIALWPRAFPRTASLKIKREELAAQLRTGLPREP